MQDGLQRISDAMFMNYWWDGEMVEASRDYVNKLGRSRYDMYFGADLSPARNAQRMFERSEWLYGLFSQYDSANKPVNSNKALSSIALFGNDVNFTFAGNKHTKPYSEFRANEKDYRNFYDAETRLFAGNDLNLYSNDDSEKWPGIGRFVPAKSTLTQLPFVTSFNTGHGMFKAEQGKVISGPWHDISQQDLLPTWQFAVKGNQETSVYYDFESAYLGGNSLAIVSKKNDVTSTIPLYESTFMLVENSQLNITYQYVLPQEKVSLWLELDHDKIIYIPLTKHLSSKQTEVDTEDGKWLTTKHSLKPYQDKMVTRIGFKVDEHYTNDVAINIGLMEIR